MKSFLEWVAPDNTPVVVPNVSKGMPHERLVFEVKRCVKQAIDFLNKNPETEDRVDFTILNTQIRVWRTKINTVVKTHLGHKASWQKNYTEISVDNLIEWLVQYGY